LPSGFALFGDIHSSILTSLGKTDNFYGYGAADSKMATKNKGKMKRYGANVWHSPSFCAFDKSWKDAYNDKSFGTDGESLPCITILPPLLGVDAQPKERCMSRLMKVTLTLARMLRSRAVALSLLSVLAGVIVLQVAGSALVTDDQAATPARSGAVTLAYDADDAASLEGKLTDTKKSYLFPAYVKADGKKKKIMVSGGTVAELISKAAVELGKLDEVNMPLDQKIREGDVVVVTRRKYVTVKSESKLPYETIYTYDPELTPGKEEVKVEGKDGLCVQVIRQLLVDGQVASETIKSEEVLKEPVNAEVLTGFPVKPVSPYDFESEFNEDCEPLEYLEVMRAVKSAGYSARKGAGTASGRPAQVGNVAVNPKVIPYGTLMFIKSSDGKHIYGYAVAADTGIALRDGLIAVDLFYATYEESAANGIRDVDIFILEWGDE
jgi:3D (Asp-Asp-Asp) domain-containing protein